MSKKSREDFIEQATKMYRKNQKQFRYWLISVVVLSFFVVVLVGVSLRFYGQAKTNVDRIYACTEKIHEHTSLCGDDCGYADYVVHTHNDDCYNEEGELICELDEIEAHVHGSECYEEVKVLICEEKEDDEQSVEEESGFDDEEIDEEESDLNEEIEDEEESADDDDKESDDDNSNNKNEESDSNEDETTDDSNNMDESDDEDSSSDSDNNDDDDSSSDSDESDSDSNDNEQRNYKPPVKKKQEEKQGHVHTDACYEIRKKLVCGKYELHEHSDECFNSIGDIVCGKVELKEHIHSKDCFVFEDQKKTRNEQVTYYASSENFKVTVICSEDANIPEEATLKVTEITAKEEPDEFENKQEQIQEMDEVEAQNLQYILDIGFYLEDEEIEPEDIVNVKIKFLDDEFIEENEDSTISIIHFEEGGEAVLIENTEIVNEVVNFETESFSWYGITVKNVKWYGEYSYGFNSEKNAYLNTPYYKPGPLGIAGNFHIVAFGTLTTWHEFNGNVLVKNFKSENDGFFNTNLASYIANEYKPSSNNGGKDSLVALGKMPNITKVEGSDPGMIINGVKNNHSYNILIDESTARPFIALDDVRKQLEDISKSLRESKEVNVVSNRADIQNDIYGRIQYLSIGLSDKNKTGVFNTNIEELIKHPDVIIEDAGNFKNGIVINVDCKNWSNIYLPQRMYSRAQQYSDASKILWNFYNCNGSYIDMKGLYGTVIALGAKVANTQSVFNGCVYAEDVEIYAESHQYVYTGELTPNTVNKNLDLTLKAKKNVDGSKATQDQVFKFELHKWNGSEWVLEDTQKNVKENIKFDLKFTSKDAGKTYYYAVVENGDKITGFVRDNSKYIYEVKIKENSSTKDLSSEINRYQVKDNEKLSNTISNNKINFNYIKSTTPLTENAVIFDNKTEKVTFDVIKEWYDSNGNKLTNDMPDSITVQLMQTTDKYAPYYADNVTEVAGKIETLSRDNGWKSTFINLPKYDSEGKELYYFAKEKEVFKNGTQVMGGYEVSYSQENGLSEGTLVITNKKISYESQDNFDLVVKKKWIDPEGNETTDTAEKEIDILLNQYKNTVVSKRITSSNVSRVNWGSDDLKFYVVGYSSGSSPHIGTNVQCKAGDVIRIHLEFNVLDGMSVTADEIKNIGFAHKTDVNVQNNKVIVDSYIWVMAGFSGTFSWDHCYYLYWKLDNENINGSISIQSGGTEKTFLSIRQEVVERTSSTNPIQYGVKVKANEGWTNSIFKALPLKNVQVDGDRVVTTNYQYAVQEVVPKGAGYYCESFDYDFGDRKQHMSVSGENESERFSQNGTITINNKMTATSFEVVKKWYDKNANQINAGEVTESTITVDVYQSSTGQISDTDKLVGTFNILKNDVATINVEDDFKNTRITKKTLENYDGFQEWSLRLNNLPANDAQGNKYYYYAVETKIGEHSVANSDYEVLYGDDEKMQTPVPVDEGITIINNYGIERYDFLPETGGKGTLLFRIKNWLVNTFWSYGV